MRFCNVEWSYERSYSTASWSEAGVEDEGATIETAFLPAEAKAAAIFNEEDGRECIEGIKPSNGERIDSLVDNSHIPDNADEIESCVDSHAGRILEEMPQDYIRNHYMVEHRYDWFALDELVLKRLRCNNGKWSGDRGHPTS
eukprot:Gb_26388 [translate_table: standard]